MPVHDAIFRRRQILDHHRGRSYASAGGLLIGGESRRIRRAITIAWRGCKVRKPSAVGLQKEINAGDGRKRAKAVANRLPLEAVSGMFDGQDLGARPEAALKERCAERNTVEGSTWL